MHVEIVWSYYTETKVVFYHFKDLNVSIFNLKETFYSDFGLEIIPRTQWTHEWFYLLFSIMSKHIFFMLKLYQHVC